MVCARECTINEINRRPSHINSSSTSSQIFHFGEPVLIYWEHGDGDVARESEPIELNQTVSDNLKFSSDFSRDLTTNETELLNHAMEELAERTLRVVDFRRHSEFKYISFEKFEVRPVRESDGNVFEFRTIYPMHQESGTLVFHVVLPEYCYTDPKLMFFSLEGHSIINTREKRQAITLLLTVPSVFELVVIFCWSSAVKFGNIKDSHRRYSNHHTGIEVKQEVDSNIKSGEGPIIQEVNEILCSCLECSLIPKIIAIDYHV